MTRLNCNIHVSGHISPRLTLLYDPFDLDRNFEKQYLEIAGCQVFEAGSFKDTLRLFTALDSETLALRARLDLVVIGGCFMKHHVQLVQAARSASRTSARIINILPARFDGTERLRCIGSDAVLTLPLEPRSFIDLVYERSAVRKARAKERNMVI